MAALLSADSGANIGAMREGVMAVARILSCLALLLLVTPASAQDDYPNRPIRVIVPVGPGAGIDTAARITAAAAEPILGGKFVIENKPGASMRIGRRWRQGRPRTDTRCYSLRRRRSWRRGSSRPSLISTRITISGRW